MGKHKSSDYKLSAVEYYFDNDNASLRNVCNIYKCSKYIKGTWLKSNEASTKPNGNLKLNINLSIQNWL